MNFQSRLLIKPTFLVLWILSTIYPLHLSAGEQTEKVSPGLCWCWFNSRAFSRPHETGISGQINIDTGKTFNDYSQLWVGLIEFPTDKPVTFTAEADNGLRLTLNGTRVIDGFQENGTRKGTFQAEAGKRIPIRVGYIQNGGVGFLRLFWEWDGHPKELIPASAFFHTGDQKKMIEGMKNGGFTNEDRSIIYQEEFQIPGRALKSDWPIPSHPGPHLLIDDYLIEKSTGVERVVLQPQRDISIPNPIITGPVDRIFQPFFTVLHDETTGKWRIWYGAYTDDKNTVRSRLATMESDDGIHFQRPHQICKTPEIQFGSEVIDRGENHPDPASRYIYSYWLEGGTRFLVSPDGENWKQMTDKVVLPHNHDITGIDYDPLRKVYVATYSHYIRHGKWTGLRRTPMMSFTKDFVNWTDGWLALTANDRLDEGETQFYSMEAYLNRGPLRIGMVKVLRDDKIATGTQPGSRGRAHTSLAWSRDGKTWVRDREMYFEPDDNPKAWDHAHAWIDEQIIVGDQVYFYYSGYKQGHKINRFEERQLGLARIPLDRYVARRAGDSGQLKTVPFQLDKSTKHLQVNANASKGSLLVQVRDAETGKIIPGMSFEECQRVTSDGIHQNVEWKKAQLSQLAGKTIQLEFRMKNADFFALEFMR